jgi:hypothetical protein
MGNNDIIIGMGATVFGYSDSSAYTVIKISKSGKKVFLQKDKSTLDPNFKPNIIPGGFAGHCTNNYAQEYTYESDSNGHIIEVSLRKNGKWVVKGEPTKGSKGIKFGVRREFFDYNF